MANFLAHRALQHVYWNSKLKLNVARFILHAKGTFDLLTDLVHNTEGTKDKRTHVLPSACGHLHDTLLLGTFKTEQY